MTFCDSLKCLPKISTSSSADQLVATVTGDISLILAKLQHEMKIGTYTVVGLEGIANADGAPLV